MSDEIDLSALTPLQMVDEMIASGQASLEDLRRLRQRLAPVRYFARHWRRPAALFEINGVDVGLSEAEGRVVTALLEMADGQWLPRAAVVKAFGSEKSTGARMTKLRAKIAKCGATIECRKYQGYRLADIGGVHMTGEAA